MFLSTQYTIITEAGNSKAYSSFQIKQSFIRDFVHCNEVLFYSNSCHQITILSNGLFPKLDLFLLLLLLLLLLLS